MDIKKYLKENMHQMRPAYNFARACISNITTMREKSNIFDYVDVGLQWKQNYEEIYGARDHRLYFSDLNWKYVNVLNGIGFREVVIKLLNTHETNNIKIIKQIENVKIYQYNCDDVSIGWVITSGNGVEEIFGIYTPTDKEELACKKISDLIWGQFKSTNINVGSDDQGVLCIKEDNINDGFIMSKKAVEQTKMIQQYMDGGLGRSILYYGPPGSGKSNCVRGICSTINAKAVRFNDLPNFDIGFVAELLTILNPDAVVLEDIDNLILSDVSDLLSKLEIFNNKKKLILATANQVTKLDNAMIRPGRFDQAIEINKIDDEIIMSLIDSDPDIFKIVKDFPVAFIVEFMKRVKIIGKEQTIQTMDDLLKRIENFNQANYTLESYEDYSGFKKNALKLIRPRNVRRNKPGETLVQSQSASTTGDISNRRQRKTTKDKNAGNHS